METADVHDTFRLHDERESTREIYIKLPGKGNSNSHGARPVQPIISMLKWIRTSRLSNKLSLSLWCAQILEGLDFLSWLILARGGAVVQYIPCCEPVDGRLCCAQLALPSPRYSCS